MLTSLMILSLQARGDASPYALPLPEGSLLLECESLTVCNWHRYSDPEASGGAKILANDPTWVARGDIELPGARYTVWVRSADDGHYPGHYHYDLTIDDRARTMAKVEPLAHNWVWERWGEVRGGRHTIRLDRADSFPAQADCILFTPDPRYRPSGRPLVEMSARVGRLLPRTGASCEVRIKPFSHLPDQKFFCALRRGGTLLWSAEIPLPVPASRWPTTNTTMVRFDLPALRFASPGELTLTVELSGCELTGHEEGDYTMEKVILDTWKPATPCAAKVRTWKGAPTLFIAGRPRFGFAFLGVSTGCYPEFASAGGHLFSVGASIGNSAQGKFNADEANGPYQTVLEADSHAFILPRIGVTAPQWWLESHPEERVVYDDGSLGPQSMASTKWLEQISRDLAAYVRHTRHSPYADRVIGYHFCSGESAEWQAWGLWSPRRGDFSPPMRRAFQDWLRVRYRSVEALRNAWHDATVTFDAATVPSVSERQVSGSVLLDPARSQRVIDFFEFYPSVTAKAITRLARVIKEASDNKALAGVFYGYAPQYGPVAPESQHLGLATVLASRDVDFLCSPAMYSDRQPGGTTNFMSLIDSVQRHGKYWFDEADIRTHLQQDAVGRCRNMAETLGVLKREYGAVRAQGAGMWWFDMGTGWFSAPEIGTLFQGMQQSGEEALRRDSAPRFAPEVGVFYDEKSAFRQSPSGSSFFHFGITMQIASLRRMGAPVALHLLSDLPAAPDYKVYVFLNATDLTSPQRKALDRLKQGRRMLVFIYAPGLGRVNDRGLVSEDLRGMREVTGIDITLERTPGPVRAKLVDNEPLCSNPVLLEEYGGSDGAFGPTGGFSPRCSVVDTGATVLARYPDGSPAMMTKHMGDWTLVYSAVPGVPPGILHNLAREAGVHLFTSAGDALYAGRGCVTLHAREAGRKVLRLPGRFDVQEALGGGRSWAHVDQVDLDLAANETAMLTVK